MKNTRWYKTTSGDRAASEAFEYARELDNARDSVLQDASKYLTLYDGRGQLVGRRFSPLKPPDESFTSENVAKAVIDTAMALVARANPRVVFLTDGGDFSEMRRARDMERFLEGLFDIEDVAKKRRLAMRDAFIGAGGYIKVSPDYAAGRPRFDRVMLDEVLVDEWEARNGYPMELLHRYYCDRASLKSIFDKPKDRAAIEKAPAPADMVGEAVTHHPAAENLIEVIEGYRLPSAVGTGDGVYACMIEGHTLRKGEWTRSEFPFVRYAWTDATVGWYPTGLLAEIAGMQVRLHRENAVFDESMDRLAWPRVYVSQADAENVKGRMVPQVGVVIPIASGEKPVVEAPRVLSPDMVQMHQQRHNLMFKLTGVGEMAAFAKKPSDIRSAPALREMTDVQSERFVINIMDSEKFTLELGRHAIHVAKQMYAGKRADPQVYWKSRHAAKRIKWSEVELPNEAYCMNVQAASVLARSPAGRKDFVMDLLQAGLLEPRRALKMLDIPDLEKESDLELAVERDIDATIEALEDASVVIPDPYQDHALLERRVRQNYLRIRHLKAPEKVLKAHRDFLRMLGDILAKQQEAAQQQQMAMMQAQAAMQGGGQPPAEEPPPLDPTEEAVLADLEGAM